MGYDADGHVVSRAYSDGTATSATYTDTGLLATTTDVTGAVTTYDYDAARPDDVRHPDPRRRRRSPRSPTPTTRCPGSHTTTRGNGVTTTNTWTPRNQLATQRTTTASGAVIEEHVYTYDSHGNVARRTDTVPAVGRATTAGTWTTAYRYDAYDRLIGSATYPGADGVGDAVDVDHVHPQHRR